MTLSEAVEGVGRLLGAFPNGRPESAQSYIGALAAILVDYPRRVSMRCCDPKLGVARETRFLPTVADLVAWCERETELLRRPVDIEDRYARFQTEHGDASLPRDKRETYAELKARHESEYGPVWGITNRDIPLHSRVTAEEAHALLVNEFGEAKVSACPNTMDRQEEDRRRREIIETAAAKYVASLMDKQFEWVGDER